MIILKNAVQVEVAFCDQSRFVTIGERPDGKWISDGLVGLEFESSEELLNYVRFQEQFFPPTSPKQSLSPLEKTKLKIWSDNQPRAVQSSPQNGQ